MIISLLFEPFSNSSLQHLRFVCAIWHDCIFGGNGRLYTGFWVVLSLSTLYFWLAGKAKTKQAVNRMSEWVEGVAVEKATNPGRRLFFSPLGRASYKTAMVRELPCNIFT